MKRRTVLAAVGTTVALAGCLEGAPDATGDDDDTTGETDHDDETETNGDADDSDTDDSGSDTDTRDAVDSVASHFDDEPDRPECEVESETIEVEHDDETLEYETAEPVPYPEPLESVTDDDVLEYLEAFEHAYVTHNAICDGAGTIIRVEYAVDTIETFAWYEDVTIVFLYRAGGASRGLDSDGYEWVADIGFEGVVYAIDDTGVARVRFDDVHEFDEDEREANAPDPLEDGELVEQFE